MDILRPIMLMFPLFFCVYGLLIGISELSSLSRRREDYFCLVLAGKMSQDSCNFSLKKSKEDGIFYTFLGICWAIISIILYNI